MSQSVEGQEPNEQVTDDTAVDDNDGPQLTLEEWKAEAVKARREAAGKRVKNKEVEAQLAELAELKKAQMTELEREKAEKAELQAEMVLIRKEKAQRDLAAKYKLDDDLAEFIKGDTPEEMEKSAKKLAEKMKSGLPGANGMLAGSRGKPVGASNDLSADKMLRDLIAGK